MRRTGLPFLILLAFCVFVPAQEPPSPAVDADVKMLRDAGFKSDGAALLDYFRSRTMTEAKTSEFNKLITRLGHRSFAVRERTTLKLMQLGRPALPFLRIAAQSDELEVSLRANRCIEKIEAAPHTDITSAAARLLVKQRAAGAVQVLLDYLPSAEWESTKEELLSAIAKLAISGQPQQATVAPEVLRAATAKHHRQREASAYVLGRVKTGHEKLLRALESDEAAPVRYRTALSLLRRADKQGMATLLDLLADAPLEIAHDAEDVLFRLAKKNPPETTLGNGAPNQRKQSQQVWSDWWKQNQEKVDLSKLDLDQLYRGIIVACEIDGLGNYPGWVAAYNRQGRQLWKIDGLRSPNDFQLLHNGHILAAEYWAKRVTERDRTGKIVWEYKLKGNGVGCYRLRNGNTLVASTKDIYVVTAQKKVVFEYKHKGSIRSTEPLPGGNILLMDSRGQVTEIDRNGRKVQSFRPQSFANGAGYGGSASYLGKGRYLVCLAGTSKVVETDANGKIYWQTSVPKTAGAQRLRDGKTLVAETDQRAIVVVDRNGKQLQRWTIKGRPFRVRMY